MQYQPCTRRYVNDHSICCLITSAILLRGIVKTLDDALTEHRQTNLYRLCGPCHLSDISLWLTHPHCQMLSEFLRTKQKSSVSMAVTPSFECIISPSVKRVITELSCDRHSHCHPQYNIAFRICQAPFADFHSIYIIYIYYVSLSTHFIAKKIMELVNGGELLLRRVWSAEPSRLCP